MKNKIVLIIGLVLGLLSFNSCAEDFLEQVNPNEISTDSFWKTLDDVDKGVVAIYNSFRDGSVLQLQSEANRADLTYPGWGRPNTTDEYYLQTFNDASRSPNDKWTALYKGIFRANQVLDALERIKAEAGNNLDEERWNKQYGQAKFFRGLFYFYLHSSFNQGSVVIYDFVPQEEKDFFQPLSSSSEVFNFFIADLQEAAKEGNLPDVWTNDKDKGRVTRGSAEAVLGKAFLYANDYGTAATYFMNVITNYNYRLVGFDENITTYSELNAESILEVIYSANHKPEESVYGEEGTGTILGQATSPVGGWRACIPSCWLIMKYKEDSIDINDPRNLVSAVTAEGNDTMIYRKYSIRTSYSLALPDDEVVPYYQKTTAQAGQFNNQETAYFRKQTNWDIYETEKDAPSQNHSGVNVRVIRLADIYLMLAECLIQGGANEGGVADALRLINAVRHRSALQLIGLSADSDYPSANHNEVVYTANDVMEHLMYIERPLELAYEGHAIRNIDLRRWGIYKQRFIDLSQREYHATNFVTVDEDGKELTKWGAVLQHGPNETPDGKEFKDYVQAAENFNETFHSYWPLPNSETVANPKLLGN